MQTTRPDSNGAGERRRRVAVVRAALVAVMLCIAIIGATLWYLGRPAHQRPAATGPAGLACARTNVRVSHDAYAAHSEPMLAENPRDPRNLVGGSKFFSDPAHYRFKIGYFASFDSGCTWQDGGLLPGFERRALVSDVSFAFDSHDDVYVAVLYTGPGQNESGIAVSTSRDGGRSFGAPVVIFDDTTGDIFGDKPWIAVDQSHGAAAGSVYVAWSYDHGGACGFGNLCMQELAFARSLDGGRTFAPVRQVEGNAPFCTNPATGRPSGSTRCDAVIGALPVVAPDGSLAIAFAYFDLLSGRIPTRLAVTTSHDGGATWTAPTLVATIADIAGTFPPDRYRAATLPAFACDPATGQLYLAWADMATGDADILLVTSRDGGRTWSSPLRVNDDPLRDGANQFQPQLAVAPNGVVSVTFFDTRLDPRHHLIDVFLAQSVDHGASFRPNLRVTARSWDPTVGAPIDPDHLQFIGDYQGLAADDRYVHPFWNDTRTGAQEIFTAAIPSAQPAAGQP